MNKTTTAKRLCSDCGEYNSSKTSEYCTFCRDSHPHVFQKPNKELRMLRQNLAEVNCHFDDCDHSNENMCQGFEWAAPVNSCGLCRGPRNADGICSGKGLA